MSDDQEKQSVIRFERINRLRAKVGGSPNGPKGQIDPDAIRKANILVKELCEDCPDLIFKSLDKLKYFWQELSKADDAEVIKNLKNHIFTQAHEVKDIASMCGYTLIASFGESLRDFIDSSSQSKHEHKVIIQAHIDAIEVAWRKGIKEDGGLEAAELQAMVQKAIQQHK